MFVCNISDVTTTNHTKLTNYLSWNNKNLKQENSL